MLQSVFIMTNRKEMKFYQGHVNVFEHMREPTNGEELYMLSLSGLLPISKGKSQP